MSHLGKIFIQEVYVIMTRQCLIQFPCVALVWKVTRHRYVSNFASLCFKKLFIINQNIVTDNDSINFPKLSHLGKIFIQEVYVIMTRQCLIQFPCVALVWKVTRHRYVSNFASLCLKKLFIINQNIVTDICSFTYHLRLTSTRKRARTS